MTTWRLLSATFANPGPSSPSRSPERIVESNRPARSSSEDSVPANPPYTRRCAKSLKFAQRFPSVAGRYVPAATQIGTSMGAEFRALWMSVNASDQLVPSFAPVARAST